jgi:hypothetical protein
LGLVKGTAPSLAVWLAPVGGLVTGQLVLGRRQHVRFVSGVATFDGSSRFIFRSLKNDIAPAMWPEFQQRTDLTVTVAQIDGTDRVSLAAVVRNGTLMIAAFSIETPFQGRVAWMIDLGPDIG